jgi:hypothetical protein
LVGSCYKLSEEYRKDVGVIEAPAQLSELEVREFTAYLSRFQPEAARLISTKVKADYAFLSAVYRLLPPARGQIRVGVTQEASYAEQILKELADDAQSETETVLGAALRTALQEAGVSGELSPRAPDRRAIGDELVTEFQELTGLVMVPGQFGLAVPLDLLMRALGKRTTSHFLKLLANIDILRWGEDTEGNIEIGPRNALEAQLLVESRMGGAHTEAAFAERLLLELRESGGAYAKDIEVNFAVDLLRKMGSTGSKKSYFLPQFKNLAGTLRRLREERGIENPRLMLQEANLLREGAIGQARSQKAPDEISRELGEIPGILTRALEKAEKGSPTRTHLLVELASTLSARAFALRDRPAEALRCFEEARAALTNARITDPTSAYPIDVLSWLTRDMLEVLDERQKVEALADVFHMFQTANPSDFDAQQQERFHRRRLEYGELLSMTDLADDAFAALEAQGSTAGYYLRAFRKSGLPESAERLAARDVTNLSAALAYLQANRDKVSHDARCLDLMLELWWLIHTRGRLLDRERATVPLTTPELRECLSIILSLEQTGGSQRPVILLFLRALVVFHLGDVEQSIQLFRLVESESFQIRGLRRIIRSYLASNPDGTPRKYHGTVAWVSQTLPVEPKGEVYVEELRRRIQFIPQDFHMPDIRKGQSLPEFHIAFNFIGAVADPVERYKPSAPASRRN